MANSWHGICDKSDKGGQGSLFIKKQSKNDWQTIEVWFSNSTLSYLQWDLTVQSDEK